MEKFFQRQLQIPSFNQSKLNMSVLIVGLGGTGTHIALASVRLGIQNLFLIDYDIIEASNLNRQILYIKTQLGKSKVISAQETLEKNNILTSIDADEFNIFKNWQKFIRILKKSDFIFCCLDLPVIKRLIVASVCLYFQKPMIYAGIDVINANSGMILFQPPNGKPCYECMEACLPQIDEQYWDLFKPDKIIELDEINIERIQKAPNIIASSNYYIASLISNMAVSLMVQHVQDWGSIPNRIIFDSLNWKLSAYKLNRADHCKIC
ncbi:MAG: HesA/MoeB/ThiF family protein [Candidatus Helarchaeota archaeon]